MSFSDWYHHLPDPPEEEEEDEYEEEPEPEEGDPLANPEVGALYSSAVDEDLDDNERLEEVQPSTLTDIIRKPYEKIPKFPTMTFVAKAGPLDNEGYRHLEVFVVSYPGHDMLQVDLYAALYDDGGNHTWDIDSLEVVKRYEAVQWALGNHFEVTSDDNTVGLGDAIMDYLQGQAEEAHERSFER